MPNLEPKTEAALRILDANTNIEAAEELEELAVAHLLDLFTDKNTDVSLTPDAFPPLLRALADWSESPDVPPLQSNGIHIAHSLRGVAVALDEYFRRGA